MPLDQHMSSEDAIVNQGLHTVQTVKMFSRRRMENV
jgi:hypothetical protein